MPVPSPEIPEGLDQALTLVRAAMNEAAKQHVPTNVAVWALVLEAVSRLTELHGPQAAAELFATLQADLRQQGMATAERARRAN